MQNLYDYLGNILNIAADGTFVDVTSKGIDNTGVTDVADAINALIANGGMFFFPKGTYLLGKQLVVNSNTTIMGEGSETIFRAAASMDAVYNTICNRNASNINARLCRNTSVDGHPGTSEYITEYDHDIVLMNFTVDGNWQNRDLVNWNKYYNEKGTQIAREPGTNLEIQSAYNVVIDRITAINGVQHNINIRAGAYGYGMGVNYECVFPCHEVVISNCFASNERYDDCITTHDSYNILIDSCVASVENNANGTYSKAVSNGFEIDDGSRFVEVRNCRSYYTLAGFQAKGHENTPPAHDVIFDNCIGFYNQHGFSVACGPYTEYESYKTLEGRCHNIRIINCSIIKPYAFSNAPSWLGSLLYMDIKAACDVYVENLIVDNSAPPSTVQNNYGIPARQLFYMRDRAYNVWFKNVRFTTEIATSNSDAGLFNVLGTCSNLFIFNVFLNGVSGFPVVNFAGNSSDYLLVIDGIYTPKVAETDTILKIGNGTDTVQVLGERRNMIYVA